MPLYGVSMSYSINTVISDGIETQYPISFINGIYNRDKVKVSVEDDLDGTGAQLERSFTWLNDGLIELDVAAPAGKKVTITRTMDKDTPDVDYVDGSILDERNLDQSMNQLINILQELLDGRGISGFNDNINMLGNYITGLVNRPGDPTSAISREGILDVVKSALQEVYDGSPLAASAFSPISWHDQVIASDVTIPDSKNAWSFGPTITIQSDTTITVGTGSFWTIANGEQI